MVETLPLLPAPRMHELYIVDLTEFIEHLEQNYYTKLLSTHLSIVDMIGISLSVHPHQHDGHLVEAVFEVISYNEDYYIHAQLTKHYDGIEEYLEHFSITLDNYLDEKISQGIYVMKQWVDSTSVLVERVEDYALT